MFINLLIAGILVVSPDGKSPEAARDEIRQAKARGDRSAWEVRVKRGVYALKTPLVFTPADSGTPAAPVVWIGEEGAVLSGGGVLKDWTVSAEGVWERPIPLDASGRRIYFESLYVNGRRASRARLAPKGGFHIAAGYSQDYVPDGKGETNLVYTCHFKEPEIKRLAELDREELPYVQLRAFVKWSYGSMPVDSFDAATGTVKVHELAGPWTGFWWKRWDGDAHNYYYFENVRGAFTEPGSWLYDVKAGKIRYRPLPGERPDAAEIIAPTAALVSVVEFRGEPDRRAFVHDLEFRNLAFTATRTDGFRDESTGFVRQNQLQAARCSGAAVYALGAHRLVFDGCRVFNTENYGFKFDDGCVSNAVVNSEIVDAGAGGVWIGNTQGNLLREKKYARVGNPWDYPFETRPLTNETPRAVAFITVDNCFIHHLGRVNPEGVGVVITHGSDCRVTHNEIDDLYYTGVSLGWTWGYYGSYAQRNVVAFNRITNLGHHLMADMGGVYTLAASFGTVVTNNVIMNVDSISYGGWGLYNDEGSEGILWENNLVVNTSDDSYHLHFGRNNTVRNNILLDGAPDAKLRVSREEKHQQVAFDRNIVAWHRGRLCGGGNQIAEGKAKVTWNNNLFWSYTGLTELNGLVRGFVGDPKFVDVERGDYRLAPDSPALKLGFRPIDYARAGRRGR